MMKNKLFLRLATEEEREYYKKDYAPCMIGDGELTEDDTLVIAYLIDELHYVLCDVALFIYERVSDDVIDSICLVNLNVGNWFVVACKEMFKHWADNCKVARIPVAKDSQIVQWCDKLYERIEEDEDSIIFDGMRTKNRRTHYGKKSKKSD